jgi:hypothetical protein
MLCHTTPREFQFARVRTCNLRLDFVVHLYLSPLSVYLFTRITVRLQVCTQPVLVARAAQERRRCIHLDPPSPVLQQDSTQVYSPHSKQYGRRECATRLPTRCRHPRAIDTRTQLTPAHRQPQTSTQRSATGDPGSSRTHSEHTSCSLCVLHLRWLLQLALTSISPSTPSGRPDHDLQAHTLTVMVSVDAECTKRARYVLAMCLQCLHML